MMNEELDRILLKIIKEQQEPKLKMVDPHDPRCRRLLDTLREGTTPPIDIFYVLSKGEVGRYWYVDEALDEPNAVYFEPHIFDYDGKELNPHSGHTLDEVISVNREELYPNFALIVDDSWESGDTVRKTVAYLEDVGYGRGKIFVFHYSGSGAFVRFRQFRSESFGFINHNPVLLSATTMLDFFDHPEKYQ